MKELKKYSWIGIIFVWIVGTIWHFVYEWSGSQFIVGLFFPVSESVWEHMKLIFFPMLLYSFYMEWKLKDTFPCIGSSLMAGILSGTCLIPVFFYTYSGVLGTNYMTLDIAAFLGSVAGAFFVTYRLTQSGKTVVPEGGWRIFVGALAVCFLLFTYQQPDLGIFICPE